MRLEDYYGEVIALDFDLCAAHRLWYYELEKEKRQAEMMGVAPLANMFGTKPEQDKSGGNKTFW